MPLGFAMKRQTDVTTVHDCSSHICGCVVQLYLPLVWCHFGETGSRVGEVESTDSWSKYPSKVWRGLVRVARAFIRNGGSRNGHFRNGGWTCRDLFDASQLVDTSLANLQIQAPFRACVFRKSLVKLMMVAVLLRTSLRVHCRAACVMSWTSQRKHEKAMQISRPSVEFFQVWDRWQPRLTSKSCNVGARWREALWPAPFCQSLSFHATWSVRWMCLKLQLLTLKGFKTFKWEHFPDWYQGCLSWRCHAAMQ